MVARYLLAYYSEEDTEAVMRSKIPNWAADDSRATFGRVPANALIPLKSDIDAFVRALYR